MSCSKPLPPFVFDSLYYLNRDQLERFSIVCRPLKNFIERYLHTKPYRVFDHLQIRGGSYALIHNEVQWHPNYSAQRFLGNILRYLTDWVFDLHTGYEYYSFSEMRPYLAQTVRIEKTVIDLDDGITYNPEHIVEMESISHVWSDRKIRVWKGDSKIVAKDFQLILDSPTILQCRCLVMSRAQFSLKDYKILYNVKIIENHYYLEERDLDYWLQFLGQPGVKPLVVLCELRHKSIKIVLDHLSTTFSSAVLPNAFKIVFNRVPRKLLTEFRKTNETSGEKLELKKGLPAECQNEDLKQYFSYTLERSSI